MIRNENEIRKRHRLQYRCVQLSATGKEDDGGREGKRESRKESSNSGKNLKSERGPEPVRDKY